MSAQVSPYLGMIVMGVAYSLLASALWPIAALLIPEYQLGTAYGLMQAIQNLGTALITMAAGTIVDEYGYDWLEASVHITLCIGNGWGHDADLFPSESILGLSPNSSYDCRFSLSGCWECPWPPQCACGSVTVLPMDTST